MSDLFESNYNPYDRIEELSMESLGHAQNIEQISEYLKNQATLLQQISAHCKVIDEYIINLQAMCMSLNHRLQQIEENS